MWENTDQEKLRIWTLLMPCFEYIATESNKGETLLNVTVSAVNHGETYQYINQNNYSQFL